MLTFDLFSALLDSRTGGSTALQRIADRRGWPVDGEAVYDRWDALTKQAHAGADVRAWRPHAELAREAMATVLRELGLPGEAAATTEELFASLPQWPLWPDVAAGLAALGTGHRLGVLSNVDDALFASTRVAPLVDPALVLTSQRLQAYKPAAELYHRAQRVAGPLLHVASSARDVRGALEAGVPVVRLARPGHHVDPGGPQPPHTVHSVAELAGVLPRLLPTVTPAATPKETP